MEELITVDTPSGPIRGRAKDNTYLFAGVPYAAPPVESLRFKPPQPHTPWIEPLEAFKFGPAAPQVSTGGMTDSAPVRWDEDCLTLNISTPACDETSRAVLVWIHGGGYRTGQGAVPWYNGTRFSADGDIVVVSINYRLGALGFTDLSHLGDEYALSGVCGTLDQIAALRWVNDHISAFGGDPERVTIAGESAGGFSVATLLGCPTAQGLFQQAIPQSGGAQHTLPQDAAQKVTEHFLETLGDASPMALEAFSTEEILAAQTKTVEHFERGAGTINKLGVPVSCFYPVHGTTLLPEAPIDAIRAGVGSEVALLAGSNADETTLWGYGQVDNEKLQNIATAYEAEHAVEVYRGTRPNADVDALLVAITTDHMFRIPAIRLAEARLPHSARNWIYQFNWRSRAFEGRLGATHALEIPFCFNNLDRAGVDLFIGPGDRPQHVADAMHQAWVQFIKEGDPGWAAYDLDDRATMVFDDESEVICDLNADERLVWDGIR